MTADATIHPVAQSILRRRSWRVYTEANLDEDHLRALRGVAGLAPSVLGSSSARVRLIHEPSEAKDATAALTSGLVGKGNLWLRSAPPGAYAVLIGDSIRAAREQDRLFYNVDAAIAGELVVLTATDLGLGSCWMAAINAEATAKHLGLNPDERIPSVIALGRTGIRRKGSLLAVGWDRVTRVAVSSRRKPLESLCSLDRFGSGRSLPARELGQLRADGRALAEVVESLAPTASFAGAEPTPEELALVVESMRLAPSADNGQTWRFVVVTGRERTVELFGRAGFSLSSSTAPAAAVVVSAAPFPVRKVRREEPFALLDHPIALTHALLVSEVLGLRWNLSFIFDYEAVRQWAEIPANHTVTALLALDRDGEPAAPPYADHVQLCRRSH